MMAPQSLRKVLALFGVVEVLGVLVGSAGLGIEIVYGAHLGFIFITGGALVFAIGSGLWAKAYIGARRW